LLFWLIRRISAPSGAPALSLKPLLLPAGLLVAAIAALTVGGIVERFGLRRKTGAAQLRIITDLKTRQLADWLAEREGDARYLAAGPFFGTSPYWVEGSRIALYKALMNLIANAVEAIPGEGDVRISVAVLPGAAGADGGAPGGPDTVELRVADTGSGIPAASLDRIFEPFYTRKALGRGGTGLGLAVVWGVVQDHRGSIAVTSELDAGTEFVLTFPLAASRPDLQPVREPVARRGRGERVLVVDDIIEQRTVACRMLETLGYQASAVASGEEAIDLLRALKEDQHRPDLLLLDLVMDPGMSGLEAFRTIREFAPDQRAIFASGYAPPDMVRNVAKLGAAAFLRKPYRLEELAAALRAGLDQGGCVAGR